MFAYCLNNPVNVADPTGTVGILTGIAIAGIAISAVVGGFVAGISTASSGGSIGEIIWSSAIGAMTAGGIATVAAVGAAQSLAVGAVALMSAVIGAAGEAVSMAVEHGYHKNDENYAFSWSDAAMRISYAAGMSALSGSLSYGINQIFTGADEFAGMAVSGESAFALGGIDFGIRKLISPKSCTSSNASSSSAGSRAPKQNYLHAVVY